MSKDEESFCVGKEPCPQCGSKDNLARYSDGHAHCFGMGCDYREPAYGDENKLVQTKKKKPTTLVPLVEYKGLPGRKLREDTLRKYKYFIGEYKGERVQVAQYANDQGDIVAQKLRFQNKDFKFVGSPSEVTLFGQDVWDGKESKMIVVTEGEIDAMTVSQLQNNKWPVVSVPNGAQGAAKSVKSNLRWLEQFEKVVFLFDDDDAGRAAAKECAKLITPSKSYIATLTNFKDPNDALKANSGSEVIDAIWAASRYQPETIFSVDDVLSADDLEIPEGTPTPFSTLNKLTNGFRDHEMILWGAGTGCGKTDMVKRLSAFDIDVNKENVGMILLEEPELLHTVDTMAGIIEKQIFHDDAVKFSKEARARGRDKLKGKLWLYRGNGSTNLEDIISTIRFYVVSCGCKKIVLDHVTYLLDDEDDSQGQTAVKKMMRRLNDINKELPFVFHYIAHLRKSDKPHEEGGRITLNDFAGGKAITQYASYAFGMERDQQGEEKNRTILRCLKARRTGKATGSTIPLVYNEKTGEKMEVGDVDPFDDEIEETSEEF